MTIVSEKKTEAVNAYLIKNSKGEREGKKEEKIKIKGLGRGGGREKRRKKKNINKMFGAGGGGGGGGALSQAVGGLGGVVWVYKIGLK